MEEEEDPNKLVRKAKECKDKVKTKMPKMKTSHAQENGVVLKREVTRSDHRNISSSDDEATYTAIKRIKLSNDDNSIDAAETIKKIQAFIALGKSDDLKKDSETPEKSTSKVPSKKNLEARENQEDGESTSNISELQRTLQGLDDSQDVNDESSHDVLLISNKGKNLPLPLKENNRDSKSLESSIRNNDLLTPSRVSKRIQSKSIKFSAKKMLRGDDVNVLKRMIPGYVKEKKDRKEIIAQKPPKIDTKKLLRSASPSETVSLENESTQSEPTPVEETPNVEPLNSEDKSIVSPKVSNSPTVQDLASSPAQSSPSSPKTTPVSEIKEKASNLADQLGKFAVNNVKITLELAGTQKKKVRIALPPVHSPLTMASLGPDIIIKRVKPVKKTVVPETPKETSKIVEKEIESRPQIFDTPKVIKLTPRVNIEEVKKLKDDIVKIQRNIIKTAKADEIKSNLMSVKYVSLQKPSESAIDAKVIPLSEATSNKKVEDVDFHKTDTNKENRKEITSEPSLSQQIAEASENKVPPLKTISEASTQRRLTDKSPRGRKPFKTTSSVAKNKHESPKKSRRKEDVEKSPEVSDQEFSTEVETKEEFTTIFDKYFSTNERFVEHHDSLDSDSSNDFDNEMYTHFINLKEQKAGKKQGEATVYDLMQDISIELPTWNIHASSTGDTFYLVQVDSSNDRPLMKKVVELDLENNAKVYIDDKVLPEYEGNYSSYEDIRQLIYDVDQM